MPEINFTDEQKRTYRTAFAASATDDQAALFFAECERRGLIPGIHVFFQTRPSEEFDARLQRRVTVQKVTLMTGINALRLIADRTGKFEGYGRFQYFYYDDEGKPTIKSDIPLGRIPHAVGVEMYRHGWKNPLFAVARYDACCQLKSGGGPNRMWATRGEEQLAKCAEAAGLRMIAPEECGGLYIAEEMGGKITDEDREQETHPTVAVVVPEATVAPAVNQAAGMDFVKAALATATAAPNAYEEAMIRATAPVKPPLDGKTVTEDPKTPVSGPTAAPSPVVDPKPLPLAPDAAQAAPAPATPAPTMDATPILAVPAPKASEGHSMVGENPSTKPMTPAEYGELITGRAAKLVRDKMEKQGGLKGAGNHLLGYLLKQTGQKQLKNIPYATCEKLIKALEDATPEQSVEIVKSGK